MDEHILVKHNDLFALCNRIHSLITTKESQLERIEKLRIDEAVNNTLDPFAKTVRLATDIERGNQCWAIEWDIDALYNLLALALNCAPDDIRDFFIHYDDIMANCPF